MINLGLKKIKENSLEKIIKMIKTITNKIWISFMKISLTQYHLMQGNNHYPHSNNTVKNSSSSNNSGNLINKKKANQSKKKKSRYLKLNSI